MGDVHGRADLLRTLLERIADDRRQDRCHDVLVFVGDYVDRGLDSRGVLDTLVRETLPADECVFLRGNHDALFRAMLVSPEQAELWLANGGQATLFSYGVQTSASASDGRGETTLSQRLAQNVPSDHVRFLDTLQLWHQEGDYLFVHAGVRPGSPMDQQSDDDLLWIREPFLSHPHGLDAVVVHGHTVVEEPLIGEGRIAIDTGAYATGRLTCLVLEGEGQRFLSTHAP